MMLCPVPCPFLLILWPPLQSLEVRHTVHSARGYMAGLLLAIRKVARLRVSARSAGEKSHVCCPPRNAPDLEPLCEK